MYTTFFLDENLHGNIFADILKAANIPVELCKTHFPQGTDDTDWIPWVAQRGWVAVTGDKKTRFRPEEKEAIIVSGIKMIHLINGKNATHSMLANNFVYTYDKIVSFLDKNNAPCLATLTRPTTMDAYFRKLPGHVNPQKLGTS